MNWIMYFIMFILGAIVMFMTICIGYAAKQEEPVNRVHFFVARDKNGELYLWFRKPYRSIERWVNIDHNWIVACSFEFNHYGLNYKDYDNLKWEDEPLEVFVNMED